MRGSVGATRPAFFSVGQCRSGTPVNSTQAGYVHASRGRDQHETGNALRVPQREAHGENSAHRLGDDVTRSCRQTLHEPAEEIVQASGCSVPQEAAEAWVVEEVNGAEDGQPVGHRPPKRGASASTGEEDEGRLGRETSFLDRERPGQVVHGTRRGPTLALNIWSVFRLATLARGALSASRTWL